jgi:hypothetical protein
VEADWLERVDSDKAPRKPSTIPVRTDWLETKGSSDEVGPAPPPLPKAPRVPSAVSRTDANVPATGKPTPAKVPNQAKNPPPPKKPIR